MGLTVGPDSAYVASRPYKWFPDNKGGGPGQQVSGTVTVGGWAFDDVQTTRVDVLVDGILVGKATYGLSRPDVAAVFPNAPGQIGFSYVLNTKSYPNGPHLITARATDSAGNVAIFPASSILVNNFKPQGAGAP